MQKSLVWTYADFNDMLEDVIIPKEISKTFPFLPRIGKTKNLEDALQHHREIYNQLSTEKKIRLLLKFNDTAQFIQQRLYVIKPYV